MNVRVLTKIILFFWVLNSCRPNMRNPNGNDCEHQTELVRPVLKKVLVDYKSDKYKIALGESYLLSNSFIDWTWAALADDDDKVDSTGKDAFMYLGEPLIHYNNGDYLPTLFIETDMNLITTFSYSILFDLDNFSNSKEKFLEILSTDINRLCIDSIKRNLITKGKFEIITEDYLETYTLIKGEDYSNDQFKYRICYEKEDTLN